MSDTPAIVTQASTPATEIEATVAKLSAERSAAFKAAVAEVEATVAKLNAERSAAFKAAIFEFGTRAVYFAIGAVAGIVFAHFVL
jgi:uncharacterized membrane protein